MLAVDAWLTTHVFTPWVTLPPQNSLQGPARPDGPHAADCHTREGGAGLLHPEKHKSTDLGGEQAAFQASLEGFNVVSLCPVQTGANNLPAEF
jgi:hypothetical protein